MRHPLAVQASPTLHVLRVFLGPDGRGGNPLGVFLDGPAIGRDRRQAVAREIGFSETVFVDEIGEGTARVAIFTPGAELAFAGHPSVGTSWLLRETGLPISTLQVPAGDAAVRYDGTKTWVRARAAWVHPLQVDQLASPAEVDAVPRQPMGEPSRYIWAWIDEPAGIVRARYFPTDLGIIEDEATGAAAVVMGDRLGRPIEIRQGVGSVILARPAGDGAVDIGGVTVLDEVLAFGSST
jgi:predicted PhzF superfamily epimerase YddE/YHI9